MDSPQTPLKSPMLVSSKKGLSTQGVQLLLGWFSDVNPPTTENTHQQTYTRDVLNQKGQTLVVMNCSPLKDGLEEILYDQRKDNLTIVSQQHFTVDTTHTKPSDDNSHVTSYNPQEAEWFAAGVQLELFVEDLKTLPPYLQQKFLHMIISRCVLRLESRSGSDFMDVVLRNALGEDVDQSIQAWLARLHTALDRFTQQSLHPLLSPFDRCGLAQRIPELLQRDLDRVKGPSHVQYERPKTTIQLTEEQEQLLWDVAVGIDPFLEKRAPDVVHLSEGEIDYIIEEAYKHPKLSHQYNPVDVSQVNHLIFRRNWIGLTPERLNSLSMFIGDVVEAFPNLASVTSSAMPETLYFLWFAAGYFDQATKEGHLETAQSLLPILRDELQQAQSHESIVMLLLGLRTIADLLDDSLYKIPSFNPYAAFCSFMQGPQPSDIVAALDTMCMSMLIELHQLTAKNPGKFAKLERFAAHQMIGKVVDTGDLLPGLYLDCRFAKPPLDHKEGVRQLAQNMAAESRQASCAMLRLDNGV